MSEHNDAGAGELEEETPQLYYGSVDEFVREFIVPTFRRRVSSRGGGARWSARWWTSPEAVVRLDAMWRSWEQLRLDPTTGMSDWLRLHGDYHLSVLFSEEGPFAEAKDETDLGDPLPYEPPPAGLFPDVRHTYDLDEKYDTNETHNSGGVRPR